MGPETYSPPEQSPAYSEVLATIDQEPSSSQDLRKLVDEGQITQNEAIDLYHRLLEKREKQATLDDLTETLNRRGFGEKLNQVIKSLQKPGKAPSPQAVLLGVVDLNFLKKINDVYGHQIGDQALLALAQTLKAGLRSGDTLAIVQEPRAETQAVARTGGDEFTVIIPIYSADLQTSTKIIERLQKELSSLTLSFENENGQPIEINLQAASGFAELRREDEGITQDDLVQAADEAMYRQKVEQKSENGSMKI